MQDYQTTMNYSQDYSAVNPFGSVVFTFGILIFAVLVIAAYWKIFDKAGKPGWAAIIPFYNIFILLETVKRPGWWLILYFIPIVNLVITIIVSIDLAKVFGKSPAFGIFLNWLLQPIGPLILGFGSAKYKK